MRNLEIKVEHVTRVEGHGNIVAEIKDGKVVEARFDIVESPRFFEVMLQGRPCHDAAWITSRICGICAVTHTTASLRATEDAFGITPSEQTLTLRRLVLNAEFIQSHVLHFYFLAAPDLLGAGSVVPLVGTHGDVVRRALRLKKLANDLCAVIGGRHVHPVSMTLGGFTKLPENAQLREMLGRLIDARTDMDATVELFKGFRFPNFGRETEYLSLIDGKDYPFYSGDIHSSDGYSFHPSDYREKVKETVVATSTAKRVMARRDAFMVGALARFNNSHGLLHPRALKCAGDLGLAAPCHNPFMINLAQVVETVHCIEESVVLIDALLRKGLKEERPEVKPMAGRGVGVVEAPRGLLFHDYTYDERGFVTDANCIIPTGQNLANIELDMRAFLPSLLDRPDDEISQGLKMLVRAYDPCISCATHDIGINIRRH